MMKRVVGAAVCIAAFVALLFCCASFPGVAGGSTAAENNAGVQQFWQLLYSLETTVGCEGLVIAGPNPPTEHVIYGGSPIQAFITALYMGPTVQFVERCAAVSGGPPPSRPYR